MRALLERPYAYTKKQLATKYSVSPDTIRNDFEAIRNAGFVLDLDEKYRYAFLEDHAYKELKSLLHFSEDDQILLEEAINHISPNTKQGERLKRKLGSIYDYYQLGNRYLRKPYLTKIDILLQAEKAEKRVILEEYPSSYSGTIRDRYVEPFHCATADDMLHAFDVEQKSLRHYRISRIKRVKLLDEGWEFQKQHLVLPTDPFRIVDAKQVFVHLRMGVGARNELMERYPLTQGSIMDGAEEGTFDFQAKVNHKFIGLTNFILGNSHFEIEVVEPDNLLLHLNELVKGMKF